MHVVQGMKVSSLGVRGNRAEGYEKEKKKKPGLAPE